MIYDPRDLLLCLSLLHCCGDQSPAEKTSPLLQKQAQTFAAEYVQIRLVGRLFSVCTTADFRITLKGSKGYSLLLRKLKVKSNSSPAFHRRNDGDLGGLQMNHRSQVALLHLGLQKFKYPVKTPNFLKKKKS